MRVSERAMNTRKTFRTVWPSTVRYLMLCIGWLACVRLCVRCTLFMCWCVCINPMLCVNACWQQYWAEQMLFSLSLCVCVKCIFKRTALYLWDGDNHSIAHTKSTKPVDPFTRIRYFILISFHLFDGMTHYIERVVFGSNKNEAKQHVFINEMKRSKYIRATQK